MKLNAIQLNDFETFMFRVWETENIIKIKVKESDTLNLVVDFRWDLESPKTFEQKKEIVKYYALKLDLTQLINNFDGTYYLSKNKKIGYFNLSRLDSYIENCEKIFIEKGIEYIYNSLVKKSKEIQDRTIQKERALWIYSADKNYFIEHAQKIILTNRIRAKKGLEAIIGTDAELLNNEFKGLKNIVNQINKGVE